MSATASAIHPGPSIQGTGARAERVDGARKTHAYFL